MAINKVQFGSNTLMDITDTTTETEDVIEGKVFYAKDGVRSVGSLSDATQSTHGLMSATDKAKLDRISTMIGATSSADGSSGLVPAPTTTDINKFLAGDGTYKDGGQPMVILSYGKSVWNDFIEAYNNRVIVYCRASSNSNPATGAQGRMAFMAYVNNGDNPTEVEFQYYRSMSSHSVTQMGDQVFIYKLNKTNGWSVTTREASIKQISAGTSGNLSVVWNSNKVTIDGGLPAVTSSDNDKMLKVVNGVWTITNPIAFSDISGTVGLDQGGTNATSAAGARTNLDVYSKSQTYSKDQVYTKAETNSAISQSTAKLWENVTSKIALTSSEGTFSQYNAIKSAGSVYIAFVFTATVAKSAGQNYTIKANFSDSVLRPFMRSCNGGSNYVVNNIQIAPDTTTTANIYAYMSGNVNVGAAFWITVTYPCAGA